MNLFPSFFINFLCIVIGIEENKYDEERVLIKSIHVFIFHYYDKNEQVQKKAKIFRDFLMKSSFFSSVKLIETELVEISQNPFDWLNQTLEEENEDGSIVKIIIIDSMEDNQVSDTLFTFIFVL